ncbi:MAG: prenyltransferase/squalene oxidase repeat-containing protein, partial [Patescibacteria group bacterium]|nr:prenyltransferase/squalene oxidase repeat-containing protein [Patescibacteria group bacterium]
GGLNFLRGRMTPAGADAASLYEPQAGFLPSHAMATCALCEAVALTADPQSQKAAQNAVNFLVNTQNPDGGWSLKPSLPDQPGGTSDFFTTAWSVAALKTGQWVGLRVPESKLKLAGSYFDNLRTASGGGFLRQRNDGQADPTASAAGALAHMHLGRTTIRLDLLQLVGGAVEQGPALAGQFYQDLCTAQVIREIGGPPWTKFHTALRDFLLEAQAADGPEKGSWYLESVGWGNHVGGRLFCTALATLSLETYYRFPPLELNPKK